MFLGVSASGNYWQLNLSDLMKLIIGVIGRRSFINSLLLAVFAVLGAASSSRTNAQGVWLDNIWNTSADPAAGSNGQFWIQTNGTSLVLINQDFNAAFYAGATPTIPLTNEHVSAGEV